MADDIMFVIGVDDRDLIKAQKEQIKFQRNLITIEKAFRSGDITAGRYNAELAKQARQLQTLGGSYNQASSEVRKYAYALRQADDATLSQSQAMAFAGKKINRMGVGLQQAGYQIGDFAVQIQGGTNAAVALGQQGSQLLGIFGPAGAMAGAALAITTAIVAPLIAANKEAESLIDKVESSTKTYQTKLEMLKFGVDTEEEAKALQQLFELSKKDRDLRQQIALTDSLSTRQRLSEELKANRVLLSATREVVEANKEKREQYELVVALANSEAQEQENLRANQQRINRERIEAEKRAAEALLTSQEEFDRLQKQKVMMSRAAGDERAAIEQKVTEQLVKAQDAYLKAIVEAHDAGKDLSKLDLKSPFDKALPAARLLAHTMNMSLIDALNLINAATADNGPVGRGRGKSRGAGGTDSERFMLRLGGEFIPYPEKKSGGSNTSETNEKYLDNLLRETKLKAQLVGVSEQEAAKLKLLNTLEAKGIDLNDDRVKILIEEQKNLAELEKAYEAQQEMVGMFKDTLTDALMSVIDGSRSVADAFKNMMRQILSSLTQKSIIQPLVSGLTGGIAGGASGGLMGGLASGTGIAATMGTIGSSLGAGFMTSVYGGLGGTVGAVSGGLAAGGAAGIATAIGAVAAPLLAVAAVFSFFKKKTKELDSGIRATVTNMDSYVETFKVIQTKRFWGLSKKVRTDTTALDSGNPISAAIASVQQSIASTAQYLGIATDSLNDFSYEFELSLKGLSEEARMQKITEEVNKLTDAFAGLLPNVQNMQHLTDIMNERYSLETRLLEAQGNTEALRERELANTNEYNRAILEQIFAAEDAKAALDNLNNSLKETDFATLLDFNRAKAYARLGMNVANSPEVPSMSNTAASGVQAITNPMNTASGEIVQLRSEMKEMHKEAMFAYSKLIKNGKDSRDTLRSWDVVGLPAERTA